MREYSISIEIDAPPARVWAVMSDIERWHEWTPSIRSIHRTNSGPFGIGARARVTQPRLPPADWVVTSVEEGRRFDWESRAPGVWVFASHSVEPTGNGSRARLSVRYQGAVGTLIGILAGGITRRYIALEAEGLKRRSEVQTAGA
jgi:carbon monoxide dehydrogenase subunit G